MSGASPSMAVRLAVTLGATTLLTVGAVGVGAATSNSDNDDSQTEVGETRGRDDDERESTTTTTATTVVESGDSTSQRASPDAARCLLQLQDASHPDGFRTKANVTYQAQPSPDGGYELVASATRLAKSGSSLEPPEACPGVEGEWQHPEISFCIDGWERRSVDGEIPVVRNGGEVADGFSIDGQPVKEKEIRFCSSDDREVTVEKSDDGAGQDDLDLDGEQPTISSGKVTLPPSSSRVDISVKTTEGTAE